MVSGVVLLLETGGVLSRLVTYGRGLAAGLGVIVVATAALLGVALASGWLAYWRGLIGRVEIAMITVSSVGMLALHGQRAALLVPLVMIATIYHYTVRRLSGRQIVLLVMAAVLVIGGLGLPRLRLVQMSTADLQPADYIRVGSWLVLRNLTAFDALMLVTAKVPQETAYQWGKSYADAVRMIVPRWLYSQKPERNLFNRVLRPGWPGSMALTLPAEGYLNFGWAGLLAETLLLGVIYRALYVYRKSHPSSESAILAYALAVPFFGILWRGGLLGGSLGHLLAYGAVAIGIVLFCNGPKWTVARGK